ncbi:MAG: GNAT family N-acetyltransferase [Bacteroidota bacterium]
MSNGATKIREMLISDIPDLMDLKNAEKWNQSTADWETLINYKNSVNLVAELDGKIVGSITAINYNNEVAWIGMMLVYMEYRGRGISKQLLLQTIDESKNRGCKSIKLDATPAGRPVYKKIGFIDEYEIGRITNPSASKINYVSDVEAVKVSEADLIEIIELDAQVFGAKRDGLLTYLFNNSPELAWVIKENGKVVAFSLGRKGERFTQIGPVFASSDEHIKILIAAAINQIEGKAVVVDLLSDKKEIKEWLDKNGFTWQRPFERMYLDNNPYPGTPEMQYFICGPEFA